MLVSEREGVCELTLSRPETLNAFDAGVGEEVLRAVRGFEASSRARVLLIPGAGRGFSSGAHRGDLEAAASGALDLGEVVRARANPLIEMLIGLDRPVVAAVNGPAVGFGFSLALACDLILVSADAYFQLPFVELGLALDGGASLTLPARVGSGRAAQLAMTGRRLAAQEAVEWGLAMGVHPAHELMPAARDLCAGLARKRSEAVAAVKRQLQAAATRGLQEALADEAALQASLGRQVVVSPRETGDIAKVGPAAGGTGS